MIRHGRFPNRVNHLRGDFSKAAEGLNRGQHPTETRDVNHHVPGVAAIAIAVATTVAEAITAAAIAGVPMPEP